MTLKNVKDIVVGIIKQSFTNKKTLDKFDDSSGVLMYNGSELGTKINISEEENNAVVLKDDNSLFVEDKTEELQNLTDNFNTIKKYQKYENIELDSCDCRLLELYTPAAYTIIPFEKVSGNMAVSGGKIIVKPGQKVQINIDLSFQGSSNAVNINFEVQDFTNSVVIAKLYVYNNAKNYEYNKSCCCQYENNTDLDCEIGLKAIDIHSSDTIDSVNSQMTVQEIGRVLTVDPVEHLNTTIGLEDTPVGHIISHMGTVAPKHYLICDGTEYNINDYPYLSQHIIDNFGTVNHFGGDGITTFAVPDLRGEFLRGTGTATRNTGSGAEVGEHQDGTQHKTTATSNNKLFGYQASSNDEFPKNRDKEYIITGYNTYVSATKGNTFQVTNYYTSRPTNTSVLYCIKYEPTYYTSVQNTNYLSASLYSLEERVIGSWIDGKPLYEKAFKFTSISSGRTDIEIDIDNPDTIFITHGYGINSDSNIMPVTFPYLTFNEVCSAFIKSTKDTICFRLGANVTWSTAIVIIQYTKTTDAENSFTDDMIKDYIVSSENCDPSYTDDEIDTAIADSINLLNEV